MKGKVETRTMTKSNQLNGEETQTKSNTQLVTRSRWTVLAKKMQWLISPSSLTDSIVASMRTVHGEVVHTKNIRNEDINVYTASLRLHSNRDDSIANASELETTTTA